jgi:hypothetical protein
VDDPDMAEAVDREDSIISNGNEVSYRELRGEIP